MPKTQRRFRRRRAARQFRGNRRMRRIVATTAAVVVGETLMPQLRDGGRALTIRCAEAGQALSGTIQLSDVGTTVRGVQFNGIAENDYAGWSVSSAGDVNGDGLDDVLIGAPFAEPNGANSGQAYLIYGQARSASLFGTANLSDVGTTVGGVRFNGVARENAGNSVASAGDVNGDGLDDMLVGASWGPGQYGGPQYGGAYLIYGQGSDAPFSATIELSDVGTTVPGVRFNGFDSRSRSGESVASAGDVNGDGLDDVLIGTYARGASFMIYGQDAGTPLTGTIELSDVGSTVEGVRFNGPLPREVSSAGDVDGDGVGDVLIGDEDDTVYLIYGQDAGSLSGTIELYDVGTVVPGVKFSAESDRGGFSAWSVSSAGDVNGDGLDDMLFRGFSHSNGLNLGKSYLIYGQDSGAPLSGVIELSDVGASVDGVKFNGQHYQIIGRSVNSAGDVDGDGLGDLLISTGVDTFLVYGQDAGRPLPGTIELFEVGTTVPGARFTGSGPLLPSSAGDVNGDGFADVIIGAPNSGQAFLIYGVPEPAMAVLVGLGPLLLLLRRRGTT